MGGRKKESNQGKKNEWPTGEKGKGERWNGEGARLVLETEEKKGEGELGGGGGKKPRSKERRGEGERETPGGREKKKEEEDDDEDEEVSKSVNSVLDQLQTIVDSQSTLIETQKAIGELLVERSNRVDTIEKTGNDSNMAPKTDLPLQPKVQDKEDIGARVTIPDDKYQSESIQAGLDDDGKNAGKDEASVKIEKATPSFDFTTETPRPNAALEAVNKSEGDISMILKDARSGGDLSAVARDILAGKYYTPTPDEVGTY